MCRKRKYAIIESGYGSSFIAQDKSGTGFFKKSTVATGVKSNTVPVPVNFFRVQYLFQAYILSLQTPRKPYKSSSTEAGSSDKNLNMIFK